MHKLLTKDLFFPSVNKDEHEPLIDMVFEHVNAKRLSTPTFREEDYLKDFHSEEHDKVYYDFTSAIHSLVCLADERIVVTGGVTTGSYIDRHNDIISVNFERERSCSVQLETIICVNVFLRNSTNKNLFKIKNATLYQDIISGDFSQLFLNRFFKDCPYYVY